MEKLNRKKFFTFISKTAFFTAVVSFLPAKFLNTVSKASEKKVNIKINPEAIKRNKV